MLHKDISLFTHLTHLTPNPLPEAGRGSQGSSPRPLRSGEGATSPRPLRNEEGPMLAFPSREGPRLGPKRRGSQFTLSPTHPLILTPPAASAPARNGRRRRRP